MNPIEKSADSENIENARVGYQVATTLWSSRAAELWSQFNAIMMANSIVLAATMLVYDNLNSPKIISLGMPITGLMLCLFWAIIHVRGVGYTIYWALSAREIEEKYLQQTLNMLSRGGQFSQGKPVKLEIANKPIQHRITWVGRIIRVELAAYIVIAIFSTMYLALLITNLLK